MTSTQENRAKFIFNLMQAGVRDKKVLEAMETIDRAHFIDGIFKERAYDDVALTIPCGQSISAPSVVAKMTEALQITPKSKILEIGTGSGYQAAVLSQLARRVYSIERHRKLASLAEQRLNKLNISNVTVLAADGTSGLEHQAPFDRILLTAAAEDLPSKLLAQLSVDGIMVLPVGQSDALQTLLCVRKTQEGLEYEELGDVRFVPLLAGRE